MEQLDLFDRKTDDLYVNNGIALLDINRPLLFGVENKNSLNDHGLFETFEEAMMFLSQRKTRMQFDAKSIYERCNVDIIKIYGLVL